MLMQIYLDQVLSPRSILLKIIDRLDWLGLHPPVPDKNKNQAEHPFIFLQNI